MLNFVRKSPIFKAVALFTCFTIIWDIVYPVAVYALTSGPAQPEMAGFEPIGTTEMVDLASGDFKYNIPLLDVGGYPINMVYNSGVTMDQEASWVGLGWSLNPGAINRNLRGVPDDFMGDKIVEEISMQPNRTWGLSVGGTIQSAGVDALSVNGNIGVNVNNYTGPSIDMAFTPSLSLGSANLSASFSGGSQSGLSLSPNISYSKTISSIQKMDAKLSSNFGFSSTYNTRSGLVEVTLKSGIQGSMRQVWIDKNGINNKTRSHSFASASLPITFGPSYFPTIQYSMKNSNVRFAGTVGSEVFIFHGGVALSGFYSNQILTSNKVTNPAYGFHYIGSKEVGPDAILDYNTEKDGGFSEFSEHVYLASHTYDQFSVTGQGLTGMFRSHRNDIGYGFDPRSENTSSSTNVGLEAGFGNLFHGGGSVNQVNTVLKSSGWADIDNEAKNKLNRVRRSELNDPDERIAFQGSYFKFSGEVHTKEPLYDDFGNASAIGFKLDQKTGFRSGLDDVYLDKYGTSYPIVNNYNIERPGLKKQVRVMTAHEASMHGHDKVIEGYKYNESSGASELDTIISRNKNNVAKPYHFSEFHITDEQGWTYVYGIPAYNLIQHEVTFNIGHTDVNGNDCKTGLVPYSSGDDGFTNQHGPDKFYNKRIIPPYAHSYLLTSILPPDYRDIDNNGISEVDLGNPVKFKYTRLPDPYKWRTPVGELKANYNEGYKSVKDDNKANYVYGEKELWYLHRIESKTHIAEFYVSERDDALGVIDENGTPDPDNKQMKLDSIKLYSRTDLEENPGTAIPIKTVYFMYDYTLCQDVSNFDDALNPAYKGKLTLKELYFTYGNSKRAKLNRYVFHYADYEHSLQMDGDYNPDYNMRGYDRWGNYKPNTDGCNLNDPISNVDFPYTPQDTIPSTDANYYDAGFPGRTYADAYAVSWHLTTIELPSGGILKVKYEADDYAYVQNKRAMRMYTIAGLNTSASFASSNILHSLGLSTRDHIFFKLDEPVEIQGADMAGLKAAYFEGLDTLYFRMLANIKDGNYEYVQGYCKVKSTGFVNHGSQTHYTHGWVRGESIGIRSQNRGRQISPFVKTALQYTRIHMTDLVYPGSRPAGTGESAIKGIVSLVYDARAMVSGYNQMLLERGFCSTIHLDRSYIRLNAPNYKKKGGGARVKSIVINDNWQRFINNISGDGNSFEYGQEYNYTMEEEINGKVKTISSGVASYEPMIGNDENPFRMPFCFTIERAMAPNDENYEEEPFGEMFFPSPSVVYRQVTVRNIRHDNVSRTATGWIVHEFYTSYDFPTITDRTGLAKDFRKESKLKKFLLKSDDKILAASQGFTIILNDMHGKPKSTMVYDENGDRINGTEYRYKVQSDNPARLNNVVKLIKPDGTIELMDLGVEIEIVNHTKSTDQKITEIDAQANLETFILFFPSPIPVPSLWIPNTNILHRYRLASTTKVVQQYGILEEVIAHDFGSSISTKNLAYDYFTGETLLTQTFNEYKDTVYNMTYPIHWAYSGLGPASLNADVQYDNLVVNNGEVVISGPLNAISEYFEKGDILFVYGPTGSLLGEPLWVVEVDDINDKLMLIDRFGEALSSGTNLPSTVSLRVWKSGKANTPTLPVATVTSFTDPLDQLFATDPRVISAETSVYSDHWQMLTYDCGFSYDYCICDTNHWLIHHISCMFNSMAIGGQLFNPKYDVDDQNEEFDMANIACLTEYVKSFFSDNPEGDFVWQFQQIENNFVTGYLSEKDLDPCQFVFEISGRGWSSGTDWMPGSWDSIGQIIIIGPKSSESCESVYQLEALAILEFESDLNIYRDTFNLTITSAGGIGCFPFVTCFSDEGTLGELGPGSTVNPYLYGILGNWQQKETFTYQVDRDYSENDTRFDGTYASFTPYWYWDQGKFIADPSIEWVSPVKITKRSPHGFEVENRDILGLYSSARFGYSNTLPTDIAQNAEYREAGFEGFEDLKFMADPCVPRHLGIGEGTGVSTEYAHTGKYSLKVDAENSVSYFVKFNLPDCPDNPTVNYPYIVDHCDLLPPFMPGFKDRASSYILSLWFRFPQTDQVPNYSDLPGIVIQVNQNPVTINGTTLSPIIERWQKIDVEFELPQLVDEDDIEIIIFNTSGSEDLYLDDVRVFPFNGTMKSYVYDVISLRLVAELDENNFATLYEYDKEGILVRIKKETERGIFTIQETRQHKHLKP